LQHRSLQHRSLQHRRETGTAVPITPRSSGHEARNDARPGAGSSIGRDGRNDGGNAALELVVLAPVIFILIALVVAAGRTSIAQGSVDAAARDAARQASISLTPGAAQAAALSSAQAALSGDGLDCRPHVHVDTTQFTAVPTGLPASVTATVRCRVPLSDLVVPGLPGSRTLWFTFSSPLDPYRER
jgi:Flp pilus assembly protein TadG